MAKKIIYFGARISEESAEGLKRIAEVLGDGNEKKGKRMIFEFFETIGGKDEIDFLEMVKANGLSRKQGSF